MSVRVSSRAFKSIADKLDSDLQLAMIFLTVVESSLESIIPLGGSAGQLDIVERDYLDSSSLGISVVNICTASGIARTTVRRKLRRLFESGMLAESKRTRGVYVPISVLARCQNFIPRFVFDALRVRSAANSAA
jgi:DNA-binding transcriptional ArsR family regulator